MVVRKLTLILGVLGLSACGTALKKMDAAEAAGLQGKRVKIVVEEPGGFSSNLDGAWFFGAVGASYKGAKLQEELKLKDPSVKIASDLMTHLKERYAVSPGSEAGDYVLSTRTYTWTLMKPVGASHLGVTLVAGMELKSAGGQVIAGDTCGQGYQLKDELYVDPSQLTDAGKATVFKAFEKATAACMEKFKSLL